MIVKLREVTKTGLNESRSRSQHRNHYVVKDIFLNPDHVQLIRENNSMARRLREGLIDGVSGIKSFCTVTLSHTSSDIIVVGSVQEVREQLLGGKKLLNG